MVIIVLRNNYNSLYIQWWLSPQDYLNYFRKIKINRNNCVAMVTYIRWIHVLLLALQQVQTCFCQIVQHLNHSYPSLPSLLDRSLARYNMKG